MAMHDGDPRVPRRQKTVHVNGWCGIPLASAPSQCSWTCTGGESADRGQQSWLWWSGLSSPTWCSGSPPSGHLLEAGQEGPEIQALEGALKHQLAMALVPSSGEACHRVCALAVETGSTFHWPVGIFLKGFEMLSVTHNSRKARGKWEVVDVIASTLL